ncbi:hypothetical protein V1264_023965 [Littorina saxatilis]|uniref:Uncharacterized protein n=1 Tax=Littorina saxatilis TaxID=31220 RepID=A0AAN9B878_9CAEN
MVADQWQTREAAGSRNLSRAGIWSSCINDVCTDNDEGAMIACQVFGVFGAVLMFECMRMENAMMQSEEFINKGVVMLLIMNASGFLCMMVEFIVYVTKTEMVGAEFGHSCIMTIVAFLLSCAAMVCSSLAYYENRSGQEEDTFDSYTVRASHPV